MPIHLVYRRPSPSNVHSMLTRSKVGLHQPKAFTFSHNLLPDPNNSAQARKVHE